MGKMNWGKLLSATRLGQEDRPAKTLIDARSQFQRDYDRIIFSAPFRRLQNKTQVFPLPGSIFVHNRLTHSLEVASVGRSLGNMISDYLQSRSDIEDKSLLNEIGSIVSSACLAHDMGNPPFGHFGEEAIANFFLEGKGKKYKELVTEEQWSDLTKFEGNANALRLLAHQFQGRRNGGSNLTYSTLASMVKYPYESSAATKPKFGFFQSEKQIFQNIATELGLLCRSKEPLKYERHPLVFLVEAADDICYQIMDIEDAFKLRILDFRTTKELLMSFFSEKEDKGRLQYFEDVFEEVSDENEQIGYLRASVIGVLVSDCRDAFIQYYDSIMTGNLKTALIDLLLERRLKAMKTIRDISIEKIYKEKNVVEIELAGYRILGTLLSEFVNAIFSPEKNHSRMMLTLLPNQYQPQSDDNYSKIQSMVDFVSGMTDVYALDLYRKIKGISLPEIG